MFGFNSHRRCESIETLLRGRVIDLEEQLRQMYERLEAQAAVHVARESDLADRYMASVNPAALRELTAANRAATPASAMPSLVRMPMTESPGLRVGASGTRPRLTPQQTGFGNAGAAASAAAARPQTIPAADVREDTAE